MELQRKAIAELLGTLWLVLGGRGSAVHGQHLPVGGRGGIVSTGIGFLGVSLAFGLTVVTGAYALGHISGGHFNPAVTLGVLAARRIEAARGGRATSSPRWSAASLGRRDRGRHRQRRRRLHARHRGGRVDLAANGFADHSPGGYAWACCLVAEVVLTFFFLLVILGVTGRGAPAGFAPLAIGLALTLIHLISIPVTNTSVNPARSTGPAVFVGRLGAGAALVLLGRSRSSARCWPASSTTT